MAKVIYKKDGSAMVVYTRQELHDILQGARPPVTQVEGEKNLQRHMTPAQIAMLRSR